MGDRLRELRALDAESKVLVKGCVRCRDWRAGLNMRASSAGAETPRATRTPLVGISRSGSVSGRRGVGVAWWCRF